MFAFVSGNGTSAFAKCIAQGIGKRVIWFRLSVIMIAPTIQSTALSPFLVIKYFIAFWLFKIIYAAQKVIDGSILITDVIKRFHDWQIQNVVPFI
jgi:hypothetical protein